MKDPAEEYKYKEKLELKQKLPSLDNLVKICCPSCDEAVHADNININKEIAKCGNCHGVFSFSNNHDLIQRSNRPQILQPEGVEVFHFQDELDISFKQPLDYLSMTLVWILGPMGFIFLINSFSEPPLIIPALLFLLPALFFLLRIIFSAKNKIYVSIDDEYLSVIRRPFKFSFGKDAHYKVEDFDQLYVKMTKSKNSGKELYHIHAILNSPRGQRHVKLTPTIESKSKAKYIEQEIESHLGIIDRPVPEEN